MLKTDIFREIQLTMKFRHSLRHSFRYTLLALLGASLLAPLGALASSADEQFLAARSAARNGDKARLEQLAPTLQDYELASYVDYWQLLLDLKEADPASVTAFLNRNPNSYVAEKLRTDWLRQTGKQQQWAAFDAEFPRLLQTPPQDIACYSLQGRRAQGDPSMLDDALPLWLSLLEPPEPCYPVLEALILEKRVLADLVWARIRNQFEANKTTAAAYSMNYLPPSQTPDAKLAQTIITAPLPWLIRLPSDFSANRMQRELAILGIQRIARNDPRMAAQQLQRIAPSLSKEEQGWAWTQIGRQAAQDHMPEASEWYRKGGDTRTFR
jgi:soluble lytic murein transglycosylase